MVKARIPGESDSAPSVFRGTGFAFPGATWTRLRRAFRLPIYRISIFVLIITPTVAAAINSAKSFSYLRNYAHLPLTMFLSYSAALVMVLARFLYDYLCPKIIHDFPSYHDFVQHFGMPNVELLRYLDEWNEAEPNERPNLPEMRHVDFATLVKELRQLPGDAEGIWTRLAWEYVVRTTERANLKSLRIVYFLGVVAALLVVAVLILQFINVTHAAF